MVRIVLKTLLNRLARSQPITPVEMTGGRCAASGISWAMSISLLMNLYNRSVALVER